MVTEFGTSCAFVALHILSTANKPEASVGLLGSAQLLGLLIERAQERREALEEKLQRAEAEVQEMKQRRREDARANEKVVSIFASHKQSWIAEKKQLQLQILALTNELQSLASKNNERIAESECAMRAKDEAFDEETKRRKELEEKLELAEARIEELIGKATKEAQDHSHELRKQKTAFAEIVSNQRHLEAEMGRALRQAEAVKREYDEIFDKKEEAVLMVEKLSEKIVKMEKDVDQKDKILSAMLRKSKLDATEKQMLLKEVKMSKARKKQAELEMERLRSVYESRHKNGLRASQSAVDDGCSMEGRGKLQVRNTRFNPKALVLEYLGSEWQKEHPSPEPNGESIIATVHCFDQYSKDGSDELGSDDIGHLQDWVRLETEKYVAVLEQRHLEEIGAFTDQMRLKDENLKALHWRFLSMEMESNRLRSHVEELDENLSQFREENMRLDAMLIDREEEIKSLKEQLGFFVHHHQMNSLHSTTYRKRKPKEKEQETKANWVTNTLKEISNREQMVSDIATNSSADSAEDNSITIITEISSEEVESSEGNSCGDQERGTKLLTLSPRKEIEEEKEVNIDAIHDQLHGNSNKEGGMKLAEIGQPITRNDSTRKMDIHALGVSYKIKRLKQQVLMAEKLAGMNQVPTKEDASADENTQVHFKGFNLVISLLNKQVKRFQSLDEKTDDLCRRMHENSREGDRRESPDGRSKKQSRVLETFLEETFQLQRYMVATGQKMIDIQAKITGSFASSSGGLNESAGFNTGQFAGVIRTLFKEIQRGLEVRIARIIGDLEGTLACDGILHM